MTPATIAPPTAPAPAVDSGDYTAIVRKVDIQPRGEHVVYLENGQVRTD